MKKLLKTTRYLLIFASIYLVILGSVYNIENIILISILSLFISNMIYSIENIKDRIVYFTFNCTFFVFEIGLMFVNFINGTRLLEFSDDIILHTLLTLYLSLFFINVGVLIIEFWNKQKYTNQIIIYEEVNWLLVVRRVCLIFFFVLFPFKMLFILERVKFVMEHSYISYYLDFQSNLPYLFIKFNDMCNVSFYAFLCTKPRKKEVIIPILLSLIASVISLFSGQRNIFVLDILVILIYIVIRNFLDDKKYEIWIKKRSVLILLVILPCFTIAMNSLSYIRNKQTFQYQGAGSSIEEFLKNQGLSVNIISYGKEMKNQIPNNGLYTLNPIMLFLKNNVFSKLLFNFQIYKPQTIEMALNGTSFANTITYMISPTAYLSGYGAGTNYVAELYQDYGYFGVVIFNIIVGIILIKFAELFTNISWWKSTLTLLLIRNILYIPRNETLSFIMVGWNIINLLTLLLIYFISKLYYRKKYNKKFVCTQDID
ncbi:O-antigen polysaccharide polymerase Wzy family protein [Candidatus Clostridium radicumherbarum]|uniref:O-antigen polysaccharide polymerase Wzy family protein n=1 Tax=Candidatus Clostridium radicumherbarum TaxID=3381662 RepID=A0ABW8TT55_9CLOT